MPTYEYRCKACGHELEIVQKFTDDALTRCESCGADQLRKVFGSVGISFKGSGFYKNDSRGKSSSTAPSTAGDKAGTSSETAGPSSSESSSSTSSDSGSSTTPGKTPSPSSSPSA